jgi:hypothetical protein
MMSGSVKISVGMIEMKGPTADWKPTRSLPSSYE